MIPKIIHNTYKSHDLPDIYKQCKQKIIELHSDFEYRFYTDDDMYKIMKESFPEYYESFDRLPRMIMKIDMFRYFLMYKYGGLYTDMDYYTLNKFDLLEHEVVLPCNREDSSGIPECLGNCVFASVPGHPFWKTLMDTLHTIDRSKLDHSIDKHIDGHILGTGPMFVYGMWRKFTDKESIYVPKRSLFHPVTNLDQEYINKLKSSGTYGLHICTGVWRNNKL